MQCERRIKRSKCDTIQVDMYSQLTTVQADVHTHISHPLYMFNLHKLTRTLVTKSQQSGKDTVTTMNHTTFVTSLL